MFRVEYGISKYPVDLEKGKPSERMGPPMSCRGIPIKVGMAKPQAQNSVQGSWVAEETRISRDAAVFEDVHQRLSISVTSSKIAPLD